MAKFIEVRNIKQVRKFIERKNLRALKLIDEGVKEAAVHVLGKVKKSIARGTNAPVAVDTSRFLQTVQIEKKGDTARVFNDLSYAKYIEFGTTKMRRRPHFRNTAFVEEHKISKIMESTMKKL